MGIRMRLTLCLLRIAIASSCASAAGAGAWAGDRAIDSLVEQLAALPVREPGEFDGTAGIYLPREARSIGEVTVDLGREYPVDRIALIPTRLQNAQGTMEVVGFSREFEVVGSASAGFSSPFVFEPERDALALGANGYPVLLQGDGRAARFIRVVIKDTPKVRDRMAASFAEMFVFSNGRNVALRKAVDAPESKAWEGLFAGEYLVDGQTSLGQPRLNRLEPSRPRGWHAKVQDTAASDAFVELRFGKTHSIEEVRLYPVYHSLWPRSSDYGFPLRFRLQLLGPEGSWSSVEDWSESRFPPPGNSPAYFPVDGRQAVALRLQVLELPQSIPEHYIFALAEMEVYAEGENIAPQAEIVSSALHNHNLKEWSEGALTDGFVKQGKLIPLQEWIEGLALRGRLEAELESVLAQRATRQDRLTGMLRLAVAALSLALLLAGGLLARNRLKRREQLRALRNQIASDLHDDIGSNLASMTILAAGASEQCPPSSPQAKTLQRLIDIAKETSSSMHDIVWMLHPDRKSMSSLTAKLKDIASSLLVGTEFRFSESEEVSAELLTMEQLHHFLLFYKETLHNLARHSEASLVTLSLSAGQGKVRLSVVDNGVSPQSKSPPEGLKLRAEKMKASLSYRVGTETNQLDLEI